MSVCPRETCRGQEKRKRTRQVINTATQQWSNARQSDDTSSTRRAASSSPSGSAAADGIPSATGPVRKRCSGPWATVISSVRGPGPPPGSAASSSCRPCRGGTSSPCSSSAPRAVRAVVLCVVVARRGLGHGAERVERHVGGHATDGLRRDGWALRGRLKSAEKTLSACAPPGGFASPGRGRGRQRLVAVAVHGEEAVAAGVVAVAGAGRGVGGGRVGEDALGREDGEELGRVRRVPGAGGRARRRRRWRTGPGPSRAGRRARRLLQPFAAPGPRRCPPRRVYQAAALGVAKDARARLLALAAAGCARRGRVQASSGRRACPSAPPGGRGSAPRPAGAACAA